MSIRAIIFFLGILAFRPTGSKAQCVPYRSGNLWGIADTSLNVLVEPAYDSIVFGTRYANPFIVVMKDGKHGVITTDSVVIPPIMNSVQFEYPFIADVVQEQKHQIGTYSSYVTQTYRKVYYNFKGQRVFEDTIAHISRLHHPEANEAGYEVLNVEHTDGLHDVWAYDTKTGAMSKLLLTKLKYLEDEFYNGRLYLNTVGQRNFPYVTLTLPAYHFVDQDVEPTPPEPQLVDGYYRIRYQKSKQDFVVLGMYEGMVNELFPIIQNNFGMNDFRCGTSYAMEHYSHPYSVFHFRKDSNNIYQLTLTRGQGHYGYTIYGDNSYVTVDTIDTEPYPGDLYEAREYLGGNASILDVQRITELNIHSVGYRVKNYLIYKQDGRYGLVNEVRKRNELFDTIQGCLAYGDAFFIVGRRSESGEMRFGLMRSDGSFVMEMLYDDIQLHYSTEGAIVSLAFGKNGMYQLFRSPKDISGQLYEEIIPVENFEGYTTRIGELYGYMSKYYSIQPSFKYPVKTQSKIQGVLFWKLYDGDRFLGFGDQSGRVYFDH